MLLPRGPQHRGLNFAAAILPNICEAQSMTILSPRDLKRIADEKETAKLQEVLALRRKEEEEHRARQDFMERNIRPEGLERFNAWVRRAAEQGQNEIQILRFP